MNRKSLHMGTLTLFRNCGGARQTAEPAEGRPVAPRHPLFARRTSTPVSARQKMRASPSTFARGA